MTAFFAGCASQKVAEPFEPVVKPTIDYIDVQARLGIEIPYGETGFREQAFDACDLGVALNTLKEPLRDCHSAFYVLVQVQLSCRGTEESLSVLTESDLRALSDRKLQWKIAKLSGDFKTNERGVGVIRAISGRSISKEFLRLSTGTDFLMMRVKQATAIVTPPAWCNLAN